MKYTLLKLDKSQLFYDLLFFKRFISPAIINMGL